MAAFVSDNEDPIEGCIVMPRMACTLDDIMDPNFTHPRVAYNEPYRERLLLDVASGMAFLHAGKPPIAHCDLKPGNITVDYDGRAVVIDFGRASASFASASFDVVRWLVLFFLP